MSTVPLYDHATHRDVLGEASPDGSPRCQNCGHPVSKAYVRVFGETNDDLQHCYNCKSRTERY